DIIRLSSSSPSYTFLFSFTTPPPTEIYTLSLHDALPISVETGTMPPAHVVVAGGGLAGLAASGALADNGIRVTLLEKNPRLGGRATSYRLSSGEYIDNCQHVTLRCCTNLEDFYRRVGVADKIRYYDELVFLDSKR